MNLRQQTLIFRTCLATLVVLKRLAYEQISSESLKKKTIENLEVLIKLVNDEVNFLYSQETKKKLDRK
ncbi:MAG: hypothetical protein HC930_02455 [Hydrococcus sp. SU_1_0]|nr:hypothetical protein [Hydrococcus sp. SU_1_0]